MVAEPLALAVGPSADIPQTVCPCDWPSRPAVLLTLFHRLALNESGGLQQLERGDAIVSEKFRLCNQFSSSRRHRSRSHPPPPQDVVLWADTVQAQGIGGWESCGEAPTSPTSSAVLLGERYQTERRRFFT